MKQLLVILSVMLLASCNMAPFSESGDFWVLLAFCIGIPSIFLVKAIIAHYSGSYYYETDARGMRTKRVDTNERIPLMKLGSFKMFLWCLALCTIMFFAIAFGGSHWEVWFPKK